MKNFTKITIFALAGLMLFTSCQTTPKAPAKKHKKEIEGIRTEVIIQKEIGSKVTNYFRNDEKTLEKVEFFKKNLYTLFEIQLNGKRIFTYKTGGTTIFQGADLTRSFNKTKYTVKMFGDKDSRITKIIIYTDDLTRTIDGFKLEENEVIPWSRTELESWRKIRGEAS